MSRPAQYRLLLIASLAIFLAAPGTLAAQTASAGKATLSYRKIFKDSTPEFTEIKVRADGSSTFDIRQLDDDADPQPFQVGPALAATMFELAGELKNFQDVELDVRRRIANLGQKTFRYERGGEAHEVTFNYTLNPAATQLQNIFEGLGRQQDHLSTLQRRMRYDRLGVNEALLKFERDLDRKIIPEPERLLPVLDAIAGDTRMIEITRQRARALAERIRNGRSS